MYTGSVHIYLHVMAILIDQGIKIKYFNYMTYKKVLNSLNPQVQAVN